MSAGVLVVDDIPVNFGLLEAKLSAKYYAVIAVGSGADQPIGLGDRPGNRDR